MEKEFVTYEIALELKELGFDSNCLAYYRKPELLKFFNLEKYIGTNQDLKKLDYVKAPLWQQAFDWFRDKDIYSNLAKLEDGYCVYVYKDADGRDNILFDLLDEDKRKLHVFSTYEEARLKCLEKLIELCKTL